MPDYVLEFDNDIQYCAALPSNECNGAYSGSPWWCEDRTTHVQSKFDDLVSGVGADFDWFEAGTTGCCVRGGGGTWDNEYYRLACSCSEYADGIYTDNTWKVYYFREDTCTTRVAESLHTYSGYCGSASSVSVSLFAIFGAIFAGFKSL